MANRIAWTAGSGVGFTWTTCIPSGNMQGMLNAQSVLGTTDVTNQTGLDIFADVSISLSISSSTIAAGANVPIYLAQLNQDGTTYGDNHVTTTALGNSPSYPPVAIIKCFVGASQTSIIGNAIGVMIPPGTFRWAMKNNTGFQLSVSANSQQIKYRTYNTNLNN
jgi:hypothetical protein